MPGTEHWCSPEHCWVFPDRGNFQLYLILELLGKMLLNSGSFGEPNMSLTLRLLSVHITHSFYWVQFCCIIRIQNSKIEAERLERGKKRDLKSLENFHWHRTYWDEISSSRDGWWEQHCHLLNTLGKIWFSPDFSLWSTARAAALSQHPHVLDASVSLKR